MQTGKFTIFDFDKLQDPTKRTHYEEIIEWATTIRNSYLNHGLLDCITRRTDKMYLDLPSSFYINRANEIIKRKSENSPIGYVPLKTANEKMLFMTSLVFPDSQKFMDTLNQYGIGKEICIDFGETIKSLKNYDEVQQRTAMLELAIQEHFPNLNQVKTHYGTNNTGIIINKILEIAYLHPELLHTKEKS